MKRMQKGEKVGKCACCGRPVKYLGRGPVGRYCKRYACQREAGRARWRRWRLAHPLDNRVCAK